MSDEALLIVGLAVAAVLICSAKSWRNHQKERPDE